MPSQLVVGNDSYLSSVEKDSCLQASCRIKDVNVSRVLSRLVGGPLASSALAVNVQVQKGY